MTYNNYDRGLKKTVDWKLVICYLLLVFIGWLNIYASVHSAEPASIIDLNVRSGKQFLWMMISFTTAAVVLFLINPRLWEVIAPFLYVAVVVLLVAVIFVGADVKGSHSWFVMGPVSFQPAEVSKITTSLMLAMIMGRGTFKMRNFKNFLTVALIIAIPMFAILCEKETGSALVYVGFIIVMYREGLTGWLLVFIFLAVLLFILTLVAPAWVGFSLLGLVLAIFYIAARRTGARNFSGRRKLRIMTLVCALIGVGLIYSTNFVFDSVLQDHQRKRIEVLLGMKDDPMGVGYNVNQSMIAIGSGGFFGKGFLHGTQTAYGFVPEQSTDFIFCTIGEEWGFFGCLVVIALYVFMIYRILKDAESSRESSTRIYGYCVASCILMHLFINVGMTIGLLPVIGIPLPFVSYGGSSLLAFTVMLFIFIALNRQENKYF